MKQIKLAILLVVASLVAQIGSMPTDNEIVIAERKRELINGPESALLNTLLESRSPKLHDRGEVEEGGESGGSSGSSSEGGEGEGEGSGSSGSGSSGSEGGGGEGEGEEGSGSSGSGSSGSGSSGSGTEGEGGEGEGGEGEGGEGEGGEGSGSSGSGSSGSGTEGEGEEGSGSTSGSGTKGSTSSEPEEVSSGDESAGSGSKPDVGSGTSTAPKKVGSSKPLSRPAPEEDAPPPYPGLVTSKPFHNHYYYGGASVPYYGGRHSYYGINPYYVGAYANIYLPGHFRYNNVWEYDYVTTINTTIYDVRCFCTYNYPCSCDYTNATDYFENLPSSQFNRASDGSNQTFYIDGSLNGTAAANSTEVSVASSATSSSSTSFAALLSPNVYTAVAAVLMCFAVFP